MDGVHVAIIRRVNPGCEQEFESALREFARESLGEPGVTGIHLIGPVSGAAPSDYGIMRSFDSQASSDAFYSSPLFTSWEERVAPLVNGDYERRPLTGLEAFFRDKHHAPPPRWKMALLTWLGVFPTVLLWSTVVPRYMTEVHWLIVMGIVDVFVVITLAWAAMPLLTRIFRSWLHGPQRT